jgi:hypothetical protein
MPAVVGSRELVFVSIDLQISTLGSYLSSIRGLNYHDACLASGHRPSAAIN